MFRKFLIPIFIFIASVISTNFIVTTSNLAITFFVAGIIAYCLTEVREKRKFNFTVINIVSSIVGVILMLFALLTKKHLSDLQQYDFLTICELIITILILFSLFMILFSHSVINEKRKQVELKKVWAVYATLYAIVAILYFLAYYPGVLTVDSINQWSQAHSEYPWNNWHPIGHTFLIWLTSLIWNSPASFVLLQSVIYVYTFSYLCMTLQEKSKKSYLRSKITN